MSGKWRTFLAALTAAAMLVPSGTVFASSESIAEPAGAELVSDVAAEPEAPEGQLTLGMISGINEGKEKVYTHDGKVTLIEGSCSEEPIEDMDDAAVVANSMIHLIGGDERTRFEPSRTLTDPAGNRYYVFQQMYGDMTVPGGAIKVITDASGRMITFSGCAESKLPEEAESVGISAVEAEEIVQKNAAETGRPQFEVLGNCTQKILLPALLEADINATEEESARARYVWAVYTNSPPEGNGRNAELPYLAHYVTMSGEYLYSMPTILPGDTAGSSGFDADYIFEFMEPAEYTGYVDLADGTEQELTVTVMRDRRTGMYYLGNIERKIIVADCWEFLYNHGNIAMEFSPDNLEWDQVGLLSFYHYCQAWDYYNEIGWKGGDGEGTPTLILNNFCDADHVVVNNASYCGKWRGFQVFAASQANNLSQCIDVIGHEFTHCVTHTTLTFTPYINDYGAINEAMSDIQGQLCKMMSGEETQWIIGEKVDADVRSLRDPHSLETPEFSWDLYYKANVNKPTAINDYGGVHTNATILSRLAYLLYIDGGMTEAEQRAFWFAVDCTMVPKTDFAQLSEILPVALKNMGMEQYAETLNGAISATRMADNRLPEKLDPDRALVRMTLPDTEAMKDANWILQIISVDIDSIREKLRNYGGMLTAGDYSFLPENVQAYILEQKAAEEARRAAEKARREAALKNPVGAILEGIGKIFGGEESSEDPYAAEGAGAKDFPPEIAEEMLDWFRGEIRSVLTMSMGSAGQDDRTINMVTTPGLTIPLLIHARQVSPGSDQVDQLRQGILLGGRWFVVNATILPDEAGGTEGTPQDPNAAVFDEAANYVRGQLDGIRSLSDIPELLLTRIEAGMITELPADGLETIAFSENEPQPSQDEKQYVTEGQKSRPKLVWEESAAEAAPEEAAASAAETAPEVAAASAAESVQEELAAAA